MNNVEINGGFKLRFTVAMIVSNQALGKYRLRPTHCTRYLYESVPFVGKDISATISRAAASGLGAPVIGRPTTR